MTPQRRTVVEHLRYNAALISIAKQLRLNNIDIAYMVESKSINRSVFRAKFTSCDIQTRIFINIVNRYNVGIVIEIGLQ